MVELQGLWLLEDWHRVGADGREEPYSLQPIAGFLLYGPEGRMAVSLYEREEPRLLTSYAGTYAVADGVVIHEAIVGSSPQGLQQPKRRYIRIEEPRLVMETDWTDEQGQLQKYRLLWIRSDQARDGRSGNPP